MNSFHLINNKNNDWFNYWFIDIFDMDGDDFTFLEEKTFDEYDFDINDIHLQVFYSDDPSIFSACNDKVTENNEKNTYFDFFLPFFTPFNLSIADLSVTK